MCNVACTNPIPRIIAVCINDALMWMSNAAIGDHKSWFYNGETELVIETCLRSHKID